MEPVEHALDHVVINVGADLDMAADLFTRMGFLVSPRGYHSIGSANHVVILEHQYLELIGLPPEFRGPAPTWLVAGLHGLKALALRSADVAALKAVLDRRGFPTLDPLHFSRPVETASGEALARFGILQPRTQPSVATSFFWCEHGTPDLIWRPDLQRHPNGARDVTSIVVESNDPLAQIRVVSDLLDAAIAGHAEITLGRSTLAFRAPATLSLSPVEPETGRAELTIEVRGYDRLLACLGGGGLTWSLCTDGSVAVESGLNDGLTLRFVEPSAAARPKA